MKTISIADIENIRIGNADNQKDATGCTVIICEQGAPCGIDIRGGGPASRETQLLNPLASAERIHAVLLSGGSAFGLEAASGVMQYLKERNIGFDAGVAKVPLVCQSSIFDLVVGGKHAYPDKAMGYLACKNAETGNYKDGNFGAGTGATVGKLCGLEYMMKTGIGSYAVQAGALKVGAIAVLNALGDVYKDGNIIAGLLNKEKNGFLNSAEQMYGKYNQKQGFEGTNTTIAAIITNAKFNKTQMNKIAAMAHNGLARAVRPVNTTADGDCVYAISAGDIASDINVVGTLAADILERAIINAATSSFSAYGLKSANDFKSFD